MSINIKIRLTQNLPIALECGCFEGEEFEAKFQNTYMDDDGIEQPKTVRTMPVEFIGKNNETCVAFSHEYEVITK